MDLPALKQGGSGLIRWGDNGLAFGTEKQVYLVQSRIVPPAKPPADLALTVTHTPLTVTVGRSITCSIQVNNNGETAATGVALCFRVPEGLELVSAKCSQGQVTQTERPVSVDVGDLNIKQKIALIVIVTPVGAKKFITSAVVCGDQWDNHLENNLVEHLIDNTGGM